MKKGHFFAFLLVANLILNLYSSFDSHGAIDVTHCTVTNFSDDPRGFGSLRHSIDAYNRDENRGCTDWIGFEEQNHVPSQVKLTAPLEINQPEDLDCSSRFDPDNPLCGDGFALLIDGALQGNGKIVIDTTELDDDRCAITINSNKVGLKNLIIVGKQPNLISQDNEPGSGVICDNGDQNVTMSVEYHPQNGVVSQEYSPHYGFSMPQIDAICGNGVREESEQCDFGKANGTIRSACDDDCTINLRKIGIKLSLSALQKLFERFN